MNKNILKKQQAVRRQRRIRSKICGTSVKPRLTVFRSSKHISCQLIDDINSTTLAQANDKEITGTKIERAKAVGATIAAVAKTKKIEKVVFDKGSYRYHGRVKELADAARQNGLVF
ncbi:MAG: 50S ribosomal protein L18 [Patescibacteria group bacterium]